MLRRQRGDDRLVFRGAADSPSGQRLLTNGNNGRRISADESRNHRSTLPNAFYCDGFQFPHAETLPTSDFVAAWSYRDTFRGFFQPSRGTAVVGREFAAS